jgi:hypothetical protein
MHGRETARRVGFRRDREQVGQSMKSIPIGARTSLRFVLYEHHVEATAKKNSPPLGSGEDMVGQASHLTGSLKLWYDFAQIARQAHVVTE